MPQAIFLLFHSKQLVGAQMSIYAQMYRHVDIQTLVDIHTDSEAYSPSFQSSHSLAFLRASGSSVSTSCSFRISLASTAALSLWGDGFLLQDKEENTKQIITESEGDSTNNHPEVICLHLLLLPYLLGLHGLPLTLRSWVSAPGQRGE